jgi:hypothetical protein
MPCAAMSGRCTSRCYNATSPLAPVVSRAGRLSSINLWLFVPIQQKIKGFFVDFEQYPSQASSSLNASVQAALLEAMEERQVTVAGKTHRLPELFMVLATQNPIELEGTYPLPEAQRDRFLLHIMVRYPSDPDELNVMRIVRGEETEHTAGPATTAVIP